MSTALACTIEPFASPADPARRISGQRIREGLSEAHYMASLIRKGAFEWSDAYGWERTGWKGFVYRVLLSLEPWTNWEAHSRRREFAQAAESFGIWLKVGGLDAPHLDDVLRNFAEHLASRAREGAQQTEQ